MSTEKIKKELVWIRQFIHKKDDENVVIRDVNGKDIASWIDRVDAAIATSPAAQRQPLTKEQIELGRRAPWGFNLDAFTAGARFAEAAHGIKEKNT